MISFDCKCGKRLRTRLEAAGKRVKCPGCGQPVQVPVVSAEEAAKAARSDAQKQALLDDRPADKPTASTYCPKCHMGLTDGTVLCTTCGYDLRTGRTIERKRSLNERIPWDTVRKVVVNVVLLAILISIGLWAVGNMKKAQQEQEKEKKEKKEKADAAVARRVASREQAKKPKYTPALLTVRVNTTAGGPAPPDALSLTYTDGAHTAREARDLLVKKVRQEVHDAFFLKGHQMAGAKSATAGPPPTLKLTVNVDVDTAWTYGRKGASVVPQVPRIAQCQVSVRREGKPVLWQSTRFRYDPRKAVAPDAGELARIAALDTVRTGLNFERESDREAAVVARGLFTGKGLPGRVSLTRLLGADSAAEKAAAEAMATLDKDGDATTARALAKKNNPYVLDSVAKRLDTLDDLTLLAILAESATDPDVARRAAHAYVAATGKLPAGKQAMELKEPHLLLMGSLRKKFVEPRDTFTDMLPFLTATTASAPHVVLAFARTALQSETKDGTRKQLERLCEQIEATRAGIKDHEILAIQELARDEQTNELGRQALLAYVQSGAGLVEPPAIEYLVAVGAGLIPDVEPPRADGSLRLSDTQMAILEGCARCSESGARDVAIALLLRVGPPQREVIRQYVTFPPPTRESSKKAVETIQKGTPQEVAALTKQLAKHPALYPVAEHLVEAYYRYTHDKVDPVVRVALMEYLVFVAPRPYSFSDTMVSLAQSKNPAERSAAIAGLGRVAHTVAVLPDRLKPLIEKETDPKIKAKLQALSDKAIKGRSIGPRRPR